MPHDSLRKILPLLLLLSSIGIAGCTSSSSSEFNVLQQAPWATRHKVVRSSAWMLSNKAPVCLLHTRLAAAPDSSSDQLTRALQSALRRHFQVVTLSQNALLQGTFPQGSVLPDPVAQGSAVEHRLESATAVRLSGEHGCGVVAVSRVLNQQDDMNSLEEIHHDQEVYPARTFSADQLLVQVILYSASGAVLDIATVESETGGWTLHRRSPRDLFEQAMQAYVARISSTADHG